MISAPASTRWTDPAWKNLPPAIKHVITMKVPRVDADGNELGGVPVVLREAPLGTYLGWNITAAGFFKGRPCNYAGGMIPFARTKAERMAKVSAPVTGRTLYPCRLCRRGPGRGNAVAQVSARMPTP